MILRALETGPLMVNCYIVGDESSKEAMVVDPGGNVSDILRQLEADGLTCKMIVNTHTHYDHIGGNAELKEKTGAELITHPKEAGMLANASDQARLFGMSSKNSPPADRTVEQGDLLKVGSVELKVVELPGHSPCGIGLVFKEGEQTFAIVGDAIFAGSIGRVDFPGGDLDTLLSHIRKNLFTLPPSTMLLPGHGPKTTVEQEVKFNPFF